ncbi:hypothetical protein EHQ70_14645 [Leptospira congkakensis]|nr:hypothetical protein EHQ70_14645 [Leptospira congkakensis]
MKRTTLVLLFFTLLLNCKIPIFTDTIVNKIESDNQIFDLKSTMDLQFDSLYVHISDGPISDKLKNTFTNYKNFDKENGYVQANYFNPYLHIWDRTYLIFSLNKNVVHLEVIDRKSSESVEIHEGCLTKISGKNTIEDEPAASQDYFRLKKDLLFLRKKTTYGYILECIKR